MSNYNIRKISNNVEFETSCRTEGEGFIHSATLFINNERMIKQVCHYSNRTWEAYPFQTTMKKCLRVLIERTKDVNKLIEYKAILNLLGK